MFTIEGKEYELKFNIGRARLIEKELGGESLAHAMLGNDGMMTLNSVIACFRYGLKEVGADAFCAPKDAGELCEKYMSEVGYVTAIQEIQKEAKESLGFLFQYDL